jgi:hypothetical protein
MWDRGCLELCLCPAVESDLSIHDVRRVSSFAEELHNLFARSRKLRPTGFGFRILLKPSNFLPVVYEIHLSQTPLGSLTNGITVPANLDGPDVFHEGLPPNCNQCLVE